MGRSIETHTPLGLLLLGMVIGVAAGTVLMIVALVAPPPQPPAPAALPLAAPSTTTRLLFPVRGGPNTQLRDSFDEARGGRVHAALDILAPRGTPVLAVCDGRVTRLSNGRLSGIALDLVDAGAHYCYYYAHLEAYAPGLEAGRVVSRGELLGYVGNTGNAARSSPHLHFAIFQLSGGNSCYSGTPLNPYLLLR